MCGAFGRSYIVTSAPYIWHMAGCLHTNCEGVCGACCCSSACELRGLWLCTSRVAVLGQMWGGLQCARCAGVCRCCLDVIYTSPHFEFGELFKQLMKKQMVAGKGGCELPGLVLPCRQPRLHRGCCHIYLHCCLYYAALPLVCYATLCVHT